jgi:hypothetical protein
MACPYCGKPNRALVMVMIRALDEHGRNTGGKSKSRSVSFCAEHAKEMFERVHAQLERVA